MAIQKRMYHQLRNILERVARATESSLFAISSARKSLTRIKTNPKMLSTDVDDVVKDVEDAENILNELEHTIIEWLKKHQLDSALSTKIR